MRRHLVCETTHQRPAQVQVLLGGNCNEIRIVRVLGKVLIHHDAIEAADVDAAGGARDVGFDARLFGYGLDRQFQVVEAYGYGLGIGTSCVDKIQLTGDESVILVIVDELRQ